MVNVPHECPSIEDHSVVCFLWVKGCLARDIHKHIFPVHGKNCLSCEVVYNCVEKFDQGHSKLEDNESLVYSVETATSVAVSRWNGLRR
jgi:hypothetical protein